MYLIDQPSHHMEAWPEAPLLQMGQPVGAMDQRQQSDRIEPYQGDSHGVERELQFADVGLPQLQALG